MQQNIWRDRRHKGPRGKINRSRGRAGLAIAALAVLPVQALLEAAIRGESGMFSAPREALGEVMRTIPTPAEVCTRCNVASMPGRHQCRPVDLPRMPEDAIGPKAYREGTLRAFLRAGGGR